jgi:FMN phosphatase YigB (HAD superfamily)
MNRLQDQLEENQPPGGWAAIIFDYDRTIATIPIDWAVVRKELAHWLQDSHRIEAPHFARADELEAWAIHQAGLDPVEVFAPRRRAETAVSGHHERVPDVVRLILWLRESAPCPNLFIISNNLRETVLSGLRSLDLEGAFTRVLGVDDSLDPKPGVGAFKILAQHNDLVPADTVFFGDSDATDGRFCSKLGIKFINVSP